MAFQGNKGPDLVSLALNLMQMKRDRELDERRLALEEFKAQNDAKAAQAKGLIDFIKTSRELAGSEAQAGAALGPALSVAADDTAPQEDRAPAARTFLADMMQEAKFRAGPGNQVTGDILNQIGNEAAAAGALERDKARRNPTLDWEYDAAGNKRRVMVGDGGRMTPVPGAAWVPPKAGVTVNVGGKDGLDLNQVVAASRDERRDFVERMAPFEAISRAQTTMKNVRAMADRNGVLPQQASQIIASDAMAALRPEALNEGDVARLTAAGLWNKALAVVGLPPQMTVDQLDTLTRMLNDKARESAPKRKALIREATFRAKQFGFEPRLILGEYADGIPPVDGKPSAKSGKTPAGPGQIPPMTAADKTRLEKQLRKQLRLGLSTEVPASMILEAWKAENGQPSDRGM